MNESQFEKRVGELRLAEQERKQVLALGRQVGGFPWTHLAVHLPLAGYYLFRGWRSMGFLAAKPSDISAQVPAIYAYAMAGSVASFIIGMLFIAAAIVTAHRWRIDRRNSELVRKLVSLTAEREEPAR